MTGWIFYDADLMRYKRLLIPTDIPEAERETYRYTVELSACGKRFLFKGIPYDPKTDSLSMIVREKAVKFPVRGHYRVIASRGSEEITGESRECLILPYFSGGRRER